jgi:hypothetical protein
VTGVASSAFARISFSNARSIRGVAAGDIVGDDIVDETTAIEAARQILGIAVVMEGRAGLGHQPALLRGKDRSEARVIPIHGDHAAGVIQHGAEEDGTGRERFDGDGHDGCSSSGRRIDAIHLRRVKLYFWSLEDLNCVFWLWKRA